MEELLAAHRNRLVECVYIVACLLELPIAHWVGAPVKHRLLLIERQR